MIYTYTTKQEQMRNGFYQTGSGPLVVLIVGSCRAMPYLNYLAVWNEMSGNSMTVRYINPCDWNWDMNDQVVDVHAIINGLETDPRILGVLQSAEIFIHEHFGNYGMFNTDLAAEKNIYQFGIVPRLDISIPNFHDHFILHDDFPAVGQPTPENYAELGLAAVDKFCGLCALTSFPEMAEHFRDNWRRLRFFWTPNHVSAHFSFYLMRQMNERFLHLPMGNDYWQRIAGQDLFRDPHTAVHAKDIAAYGLTWIP